MSDGPSKVPTQWATVQPVPVGWMKQFRYFIWLYDLIRDIPGDFVECGLGEGNTFAMLAYLIGSEGREVLPRTLWGFDSFQGWPEPTPWDASPRNPQKGEWRVSKEMVVKRLQESGILKAFPLLDTRITSGFLGQTLPQFQSDRPIAFLHLDVDLYTGYADGLAHLFPKVTIGGVIALDEYREFPNTPEYGNGAIEKWPGCTKAVDEYFADRPERPQLYPEIDKYFIVKTAS